jgi:hypothetical protein
MNRPHFLNQINLREGHQVEARTHHQGLAPPSSEAVSVMTVNEHATTTQSHLMYEKFIQHSKREKKNKGRTERIDKCLEVMEV